MSWVDIKGSITVTDQSKHSVTQTQLEGLQIWLLQADDTDINPQDTQPVQQYLYLCV